ncbi:hypothetical protein VTN00DRAFT_2745 [Thermoascus crustaceus]|uniref:uncharacterized protein n=1 Tax=Thermoascus crustaceus TaxID=5088 RepID=UPI00374260BE
MFGLFWFAYSKKFIYILEAPVDTGGLLYWRSLHQLFIGLYTAELSLFGLFMLRDALGQAILMALAFVATILTQYVVFRGYASFVKYLSANHGSGQEDKSTAVLTGPDRTFLEDHAQLPVPFLNPSLSTRTPDVWALCHEDTKQSLWINYGIIVSQKGLSLSGNKIVFSSGPPDEL